MLDLERMREIEALRDAWRNLTDLDSQVYVRDVTILLNALDESEAKNRRLAAAAEEAESYLEVSEQHETAICENYQDAVADRDCWRARAKALERALNYPSCSNPECHYYTPCDTCKTDSEFCEHLCDDEGETDIDMNEACPFYQFDEARFAEGGGDHGVD